MKTVSLKINDSVFIETENILAQIKKPRNRYINDAIQYYNKIHPNLVLEFKLKKESLLVREDSLLALTEFEQIENVD